MARRFLAAGLLWDAVGKIYHPVALFSRRVVQRSLNFLRENVLTPLQADRLVSQLNSASRHVIPTEWEIIAVAAFAKCGLLRYEQQFGSARPDIYFESPSLGEEITFIAEVVAISDHGTIEKNPSDFLYDQVMMMALKLGLNWASVGMRFGDRMEGHYPDRWVKVLLPSKTVIDKFMRTSIKPFLLRVKQEPSKPHELIWKEPDIDFRLIHDPTHQRRGCGGPLVATVPYSVKRNPLYGALSAKAKQLGRAAYDGIKGIIVGDADCYCLQRTSGSDGSSYDARAIIREFMLKHPSLSFITASRYEHHSFRHHVTFQDGLPEPQRSRLLYLLDDAFGYVPKPIQSPNNAQRDAINRQELSRGSRIGAFEWQGTKRLKIPTRVFLRLVAGTLTKREFRLLFHRTMPPNGGPLIWFFRKLVTAKIPLCKVSVEILAEEDNDWIVFETGTTEDVDVGSENRRSHSCDLRSRELVRYFAGLDYMMQSETLHCSAFGAIPDETRAFVRTMLAQGRLLASACLESDQQVIRLCFGDVDAAITRYRC